VPLKYLAIHARVHSTIMGISLAILFNACAVSGPPFEQLHPPEGKSVIYVYRPYRLWAHGVHPAVSCDDAGSVSLGPGAYHAFVVEPGTTTCRVDNAYREFREASVYQKGQLTYKYTDQSTVNVVVLAAGEESFVKEEVGRSYNPRYPYRAPTLFRLLSVDRATAEPEVRDCNLQPAG
jgi:hypothetical protein